LHRHRLEIRVDHAKIEIDRLWLKAVQMKAEADGISIDRFRKELSKETRQYYRVKQYPTKLGLEKAYRDKNGKWRMEHLKGAPNGTLWRTSCRRICTPTSERT